MSNLRVFSAGVAMKIVKNLVEEWNKKNKNVRAEMQAGGSVDLLRKAISGEPCDLLILADSVIIESMMMPNYTDGCRVWAGNKMVVAASEGNDINSDNWKEKLLDPDATFAHHNPYGDPGGYRAVMAILLADNYEAGLTKKLMNHPGHIGMDPNLDPRTLPKPKYMFTYFSGAKSRGMKFANLPAVMDLSDESLAAVYAEAKFAVDEKNTVTATPITHGLTIPFSAKNKEAAKEFAAMFLELDKSALGFIPKEKVIGVDPLA